MPSERPVDSPESSEVVAEKGRRPVRRRRRTEPEPQAPASVETVEEPVRPRRQPRREQTVETEAAVERPRRRRPRRADATVEAPADEFGQGLDVEPPAPVQEVAERSSERSYGSPSTYDAPVSTEGDSDSEGYGQGNRRRRRRRRRGGGTGGPQPGGPRPQGAGGPQFQHGRNRNTRGGRRGPNDRDRPRVPISTEVTGTVEGVLELHPKGYGFLRDPKNNYSGKETDPFVSSTVIEKHRLREGVTVRGEIGPGAKGQGPRLKTIESVDGRTVEEYQNIKNFDELTPINPFEQIRLERGAEPVTMRVMDLLTPIGKGQRALIVAPPRSGKTMLLQEIADSVSVNHPEVHLIVLLIDERPEEVTEMRRRVKGEVVASSLDREVESHIRISQLVVERAKRLAESGKDVFILLDSITRLARAFNKWVNNSGRTGTGGLDIRALDIPKKMFGTARRFEEGGSLTVVGTALVETGGRMDDAIFQEFKGTGNMELVLSRELADRRIWPAIDIAQSGTRREEKILGPEVLEGVTLLRRSLISLSPVQAMEDLVRTLRKFPSNREFLARVQQVM